ncbi:MAG: hypothetical protein ACPGVU_05710 [Limisphaerales bacterium]
MKARSHQLRIHRFVATALALASPLFAANNTNLDWRFSNPLPHGNNVFNMEYSPALALGVQVCERGRFYHSSDLVNWTPGVSGTTRSLRSVTFLNNRIIVTGEEATILWGDSIDNMQPGNITASLDWLEDVAASTNLAVAVGDFGAIYTTPDGINWSRQTVTFSDWLRAVIWAGGQWVTVGETGTIATSNDGVSWTEQTSGTTADLNNIAYLDGTYHVVGGGGISLSSPDAVTWTSENIGATNDLFAIASAGASSRLYVGEDVVWQTLNGSFWAQIAGVQNGPPEWTYYAVLGFTDSFVLAGRTGLLVDAVRTNGVGVFTWTLPYETPRNWLWDSVHNGRDYVIVGDFGSIVTSANGTFLNNELPPDSAVNSTLLGVAGDTNLLVAVGDTGTIIFSTNSFTEVVSTNSSGLTETNLVSTLGISWETANSPTMETLQGVTLYQDEFYIAGNNGYLAKSTDGTNWQAVPPFTSETLTGLAASDGVSPALVAVGDNGTAFVSTDGSSFTAASVTATTDWLYKIRYLNGHFIVVGQNGTIITSADNGSTWNTQNSGTTAWINDVQHVGDSYYAVGTQGTLIQSTNVSNWETKPMITSKSLYSITSHDGQLLTSGVEGVVLRSRAVPNTNEIEFAGFLLETDTNNVVESVMLFAGDPDQKFNLDYTDHLKPTTTWTNAAQFEITDAQGFLFFTGILGTNSTPSSRIYRTNLVP